ncbi:glycosyltransferase family protein [Aliarcobacter cryaerophilus]|uniref:glycosyltransferase family protein n=1 Tax=Aliarcobacter cryaerophilus TaxID=28198 RepID=UPI0021B4FAE7|nr:class I SAM-dependent methyltransferase [Aliarcobacter cryaerophilus]MCT7516354.1 class I SAM-dependent methyltransferase [Aliarcobacter cryaerophilus]
MNKILFLRHSNHKDHWLNKFIDLNRTYDALNWEEGFNAIENTHTTTFDYYQYLLSNSLEELQNELIRIVTKNAFDYIILPAVYYEFSKETLDYIRKNTHSKIIIEFFDDTITFNSYNIYYIQSVDYIVTHESQESLQLYSNLGTKANFFPNYPSYQFYKSKAIFNKEFNYDVTFIGTNLADRNIFYNAIKEKFFVKFFGNGWNNKYVNTDDMISIFHSSKISLNFTKTIDNKDNNQLKGRMFDICMAGGFLLTEYFPEIEQYYISGEEIETFTTTNELIEKITYYLTHEQERKRIQKAGFEKTKLLYSHETAWKKFLNDIQNSIANKNSIDKLSSVPLEHKIHFFMWHSGFLKLSEIQEGYNSKYIENLLKESLYYSEEFLLSTMPRILYLDNLYIKDAITKQHFWDKTKSTSKSFHIFSLIKNFFQYIQYYSLKDLYLTIKKYIIFKVSLWRAIKYKGFHKIEKSAFIHPKSSIYLDGTNLEIGHNTEIHEYTYLRLYGGSIKIGNNCSINHFCSIYGHGGLIIKNNVRIASQCTIIPANHSFKDPYKLICFQKELREGIIIEDDVWIGSGVRILDGVTIGRGSIVAAGSVVTKTIPPYTISGGVPAKFIKNRFNKEIMKKLKGKCLNKSINILEDVSHIFTHLTDNEKIKLFELTCSLANNSNVVEIGSYFGASSSLIAKGLPNKSKLYCIDSWENDAMTERKKDTFEEFTSNTSQYKERIIPIRGMSFDVINIIKEKVNNKIDMLFIDGDHSYEGVKKDWDLYSPMLQSGSIVVFHDVGWANGVKRVIREDVKPLVSKDSSFELPNMYWAWIK